MNPYISTEVDRLIEDAKAAGFVELVPFTAESRFIQNLSRFAEIRRKREFENIREAVSLLEQSAAPFDRACMLLRDLSISTEETQ